MAPSIPINFTGQKGSKNFSVAPMMGKARKDSKGIVSGFIPDYQHSVETVGESEGFGSSVKVDIEMTASANSMLTKRKCDDLYLVNNERYGVPVQLWALSTISRSKRKELKTRLKMELEQLQNFEREMSLNSNVVISPSSETRSCSDGKKRPPVSSYIGPPVISHVQQGKKSAPSRKGPGLKRCHSGKIQQASNDTLLKQCLTLLDRLMSHQYGWVFNVPVDAVKLNIPDYHTVIQQPMDLGTVKRRLTSYEYSTLVDFASDVRLTFSNAMTYNPRGTDVHVMAETLSKIFETRWKQIEKKLNLCAGMQPILSGVGSSFVTGNAVLAPYSNKNEVSSTDIKIKLDSVRRTMTDAEKQSLSAELEALLGELPDKIVDFLKEQSSNASQVSDDEIEIDLEALGDDTLYNLRELLNEYKLEKQNVLLGVAKPQEMEDVHESGVSNSSIQPVKGDHFADMDVDIGENDPPLVNYPPVEIDKDVALEESKHHSSSTSSSESGSSSSESGNSSGHDTDVLDVSGPPSNPKVSSTDPAENIIQSDTKNDGANVPSIVETDCHSKQSPAVPKSDQEGEDASSERPVSPDKLYRAALLSRFADTILKAQEKTLEKGENIDPEKLRHEREQLEKHLKAEKAWLHAEAKAAEEARKKAEAAAAAKAAAEARKKREIEREAAREALLKMEKTVEINENSKFMKDLEMLRAAGAEEMLPSTSAAEEKSPDESQSLVKLGSLNFQGNSSNNPLEQLGLYMKMDEEEEDETGDVIPD